MYKIFTTGSYFVTDAADIVSAIYAAKRARERNPKCHYNVFDLSYRIVYSTERNGGQHNV